MFESILVIDLGSAKIEWRPGEIVRVGCIVTTTARPAENVLGFCKTRCTCLQ